MCTVDRGLAVVIALVAGSVVSLAEACDVGIPHATPVTAAITPALHFAPSTDARTSDL
jgi:hypothetical protein